MVEPITVPLTIPVHPYLLDHHTSGRVVLPAVEMLQHMARAVSEQFPTADSTVITTASFDRFLPVETGAASIEALCELRPCGGGGIAAILKTSVQLKSTGGSRLREHATARFNLPPAPPAQTAAAMPAFDDSCFRVPAERLYAELVPFGPAFHTVQHAVVLTDTGAQALLLASDFSGAFGPLGSPFPFDGALHAACAWAQRYCGIVAFPVGFAERVIVAPITPGETVSCTATPVSGHKGVVTFDIRLCDKDGRLRETAAGVAMRDVSGGRMTPPAWVRSGSSVRLA